MPAKGELRQAEKSTMVVIIDRHVLWSLWCLDFLQRAVQDGGKVLVLDLSNLRPKRHKRNSRHILTKVYRKNRIESILSRTFKSLKIEVIAPSIAKVKIETLGMVPHKEESLSFVNGLDSEYFEEVGAHITNELQVSPKVLRHSRNVYDKAYKITVDTITKEKITKVVLPGGRTLVPNAVIAAAKSQETLCTLLEQATAKSSRYLEYAIDFRQNTNAHQLEINRAWSQGGPMKFQIAKDYLEAKLYGGQMGRNFSLQFDSNLDIEVPFNRKLASIFVTSGFEMVPSEFDSQINHLGKKHQMQVFKLFIQIASENGFMTVVRGHPASIGYEKMYAAEDLEWIEFCKENNVQYISSTSKIDTYKLIKQSAINVVYASTVGIDSIILGQNTLVLGNVDWGHLVPEICAFDEYAIRERFESLDRIVNVEKIYPYAFYMDSGGIEISNMEYLQDGSIRYEGQKISEERFPLLQKLLKR